MVDWQYVVGIILTFDGEMDCHGGKNRHNTQPGSRREKDIIRFGMRWQRECGAAYCIVSKDMEIKSLFHRLDLHHRTVHCGVHPRTTCRMAAVVRATPQSRTMPSPKYGLIIMVNSPSNWVLFSIALRQSGLTRPPAGPSPPLIPHKFHTHVTLNKVH